MGAGLIMHFLPQGGQHMVFNSDCRLMSTVSLFSGGGNREGSREAAASERRRGLGDLHGGRDHLISSLTLHLNHCCSHQGRSQYSIIQFLVLALFRDSFELLLLLFFYCIKSSSRKRPGLSFIIDQKEKNTPLS